MFLALFFSIDTFRWWPMMGLEGKIVFAPLYVFSFLLLPPCENLPQKLTFSFVRCSHEHNLMWRIRNFKIYIYA
jgi:hypothetical protein